MKSNAILAIMGVLIVQWSVLMQPAFAQSADSRAANADTGEGTSSGSTHAVIHVENNGVDSSDCGSKQSPCRSISQAVANATENDTIRVGPGRYGDLDQDGTFAERG